MNRNIFTYFLIYLLTIIDVVFTGIGLKIDILEEANPILNFFIKFSIEGTLVGVLLFVGMLLLLLYGIKDRVKWLPRAMMVVTVVKFLVVILHLRWIALYIFSDI